MEPHKYLENVLKSQNLKDDSKELKDLETHRAEIERIIRKAFPKASLTIRYGGSKIKGTLNLESYDLDVVCYFANGDNTAGETLKEIFNKVSEALSEHYYVDQKTSALRLRDKQNKIDFHIDVVPGRFIDDTKTDCFIYQNGADKDRLKTNLDVHISHIKNSGGVPAVRLVKLWKTRRGLQIRQFVLDLLVVKLLKGKSNTSLDAQVKHVWSAIRDSKEPIIVEDPANPTGNDLSGLVKSVWPELSARATDTLRLLEQSGWEAGFGAMSEDPGGGSGQKERVRVAAAAVITPTKSWTPA